MSLYDEYLESIGKLRMLKFMKNKSITSIEQIVEMSKNSTFTLESYEYFIFSYDYDFSQIVVGDGFCSFLLTQSDVEYSQVV